MGSNRTMDDDENLQEELLQLIAGAPHPPLDLSGWAEELGITDRHAQALVETLIRRGRLRRDGERLIVVQADAW